MNSVSDVAGTLRIQLAGSAEQVARLRELQLAFAMVCNQISPVVQETRCWNRVALHHMLYRGLRERFPSMGSQMICNAIYSVSRSARAVLQHPSSPWNIQRHPEKPLPLMHFSDSAPVYFDRHTLSLREGTLSMFTLDGRLRFELELAADDESRFHGQRLLEVILAGDGRNYSLTFRFDSTKVSAREAFGAQDKAAVTEARDADWPQYLMIIPPAGLETRPAPGAVDLSLSPKTPASMDYV